MKGTALEVGDADGKKRGAGAAGEKVKSAKRIAKDMEKWAKTLNQRKDAAKSNVAPAETGSNRGAVSAIGGNNGGTSDVAFSILQKKSAVGSGGGGGLAGLAGYGSDSEEEGGSGKAAASASGVAASSGGSAGGGSKAPKEEDLVDFAKLACLLCQRQFPSGEKLQK